VDYEWVEASINALHDSLFTLYEVEDMDAACCLASYRSGEPDATGLDELVRVETSADLVPAFAFGNRLEVVRKVCEDIVGVSLPVDDVLSTLDIDWSWLAVEAESLPVPELECEDIWSCRDFENHAAGAGAMDSTTRDEIVVMLLSWNLVHIFFCVEDDLASLGSSEVFDHGILVNAFLETEVHDSAVVSVEDIVALVLGIRHTELLSYEMSSRVDLEAEVSSSNCVEEVEADREVLAEAGLYDLAEDAAALEEDEVL